MERCNLTIDDFMERCNLTVEGSRGEKKCYWWNIHEKYGNGSICSVHMFLGQLASWPRLPFNMHVPVALFLFFMSHDKLSPASFPTSFSLTTVWYFVLTGGMHSHFEWFNIQMIVICLLDCGQFVSSVRVCHLVLFRSILLLHCFCLIQWLLWGKYGWCAHWQGFAFLLTVAKNLLKCRDDDWQPTSLCTLRCRPWFTV